MPNITDVATLAGVSHQTVSRVLNGEAGVRAPTRARVDAAIRELGYRPSAAARALASRKTRTIGLVTTGATLFGPSSIMLAFNEAARAAGYQVTIASLASGDRDAMVGAIDALLSQNPEALVLIVADFATLAAVSDVDIRVPLVTAVSTDRDGFHSVSIDQFEGARLATRHLIELGHRDILHLTGAAGSVDASERERGWRHELVAARLAVPDPIVGDWTPAAGYAAGMALATSGKLSCGSTGGSTGGSAGGAVDIGATAIFCSNDQMAIGLLHALADSGVSVPGDVSVVGFDDIPESAHFAPPLTTVRQDFPELGERMMRAVVEVLAGGHPPVPDVAAPHLVARASTAPTHNPAADPAAVTEP